MTEIVETIRNIELKIEIARKWNPFYDFFSNFLKINSSGGIIISSIWINFQFVCAYNPNPRLKIDFTIWAWLKGLRNPKSTHLNFRFIQNCLCFEFKSFQIGARMGFGQVWVNFGPSLESRLLSSWSLYFPRPRDARSLCRWHDEEINDDCGRVLTAWTVSFGWRIMGKCLFGTS